jgi:hypothetical protein
LARVIYFDDGGTGSKVREPYTVASAVVARIDQDMPVINREVRQIRSRLPERQRAAFEFKADKMFKHFRKFGEKSIYGGMMREFLEMMARVHVEIFQTTAHRASFLKVTDGHMKPQDFAFATCALNASDWLRALDPPEGALCFGDRSPSETFWHQTIADMRRYGLPAGDKDSGDQLVDTIFFHHSDRSISIQMADYASFFRKQHVMRIHEAEPFYKIVEPLLHSKGAGVFFALPVEDEIDK